MEGKWNGSGPDQVREGIDAPGTAYCSNSDSKSVISRSIADGLMSGDDI